MQEASSTLLAICAEKQPDHWPSLQGIPVMWLGLSWDCHVALRFWGSFHERFFHHNSNLMEISFCSHPCCSEGIAMKFFTWMTCAKFCSDIMPYNGVILKLIFHQILITMEKSFVKWAPGPWFNMKFSFKIREFHCKDKMVIRWSYIYNNWKDGFVEY